MTLTALILEGDPRLSDARTPLTHTHATTGLRGALSTTAMFSAGVTGDAFDRWSQDAAGTLFSGDGTATALRSSFTGAGTTAFGREAAVVTTATTSTAVGYQALKVATSAVKLTAVGYQALVANSTAVNNTGVGYQALAITNTGSYNTACGTESLLANNDGQLNAAFGSDAMRSNTGGNQGTGIGAQALQGNTIGVNNTACGYGALYFSSGSVNNRVTTGLRNTGLGALCGLSSTTQRNDTLTLGYGALVNGDNAIAIGSGASAGAAGAVAVGKDSAGTSASTTTADEIKLGTALHTTTLLGFLKWGAAGNEQTTVGAAGGASALPATPTKYLKVKDSAGTTLIIPAYAAA